MDQLCNRQQVALGCPIVFIAGGLTPSTGYNLAYDDGPPFNVGPDILFFQPVNSNASGDVAIQIASALPFSQDLIYLHLGSSLTVASRVTGPVSASWGGSGTCAPFGTPAVLDTAWPGDAKVMLSWTGAAACDARVSGITYALQRSTTGPSSGYATVAGAGALTTTMFLDTGRTNGTSYWYRVVATITYQLGSITNGQVMPASNVLKAIPRVQQTYLGSLVTH